MLPRRLRGLVFIICKWQRQTNCMPSGNFMNFLIDAGELLNLSDSSDKTDDGDDDEDNPT